MLTVGVDVGGTFTDIFVHDVETNVWLVHKVPSTPRNFTDGFMRGVREAVASVPGARLASVDRVVHGTTVATNAVLTRNGARLGFMLTEGFKDILYIGVGWRPRMYDLNMDAVEPLFLAPRRRSCGVRERISADGTVINPLDEDHVREVARHLVEDHGVTGIVVGYLHSYANPAHELRTKRILGEAFPSIDVTISSEVLPKPREYRRLVVSGFDAYVKPCVSSYMKGLNDQLVAEGFGGPLYVMQSNGGIAGCDAIMERPVRTILSGLAAGVIGAAHVGKAAGHPNCISLDMGGTSADVALIRDGRPVITGDGSFEDYPLHIPMIDVRTIGAGGSSVAFIDEGGGLRVGPRSAGADPGPACYGRGGLEPTVTDASFVLGYLNPDTFAGSIDLDIEKSYAAIERYIARPLGLDVPEAALGIHTIVNSNMAQTLRLVSIKRGYDPRDFTFIPFGGAGAVHAGRLAQDVGMNTILIPSAPGVLSAMGLMLAPVQHDAIASFEMPASQVTLSMVAAIIARLDDECRTRMIKEKQSPERSQIEYFADMRYVGQSHELQVSIPAPLGDDSVAAAVKGFHEIHQRTYGHADRALEVEFVGLRVVHRGPVARTSLAPPDSGATRKAPEVSKRRAYFSRERGYVEVPVYKRRDLPVGFRLAGPAIIEQADTTTVLYPGHDAVIDRLGNILVSVGAAADDRVAAPPPGRTMAALEQ